MFQTSSLLLILSLLTFHSYHNSLHVFSTILIPLFKHLKCPYHGWEYSATDGRLVKAQHIQGKFLLDFVTFTVILFHVHVIFLSLVILLLLHISFVSNSWYIYIYCCDYYDDYNYLGKY